MTSEFSKLSVIFALAPISHAASQVVDFAAEVRSGFRAISADYKVEIVEGFSAISADEKWEVVGLCTNRPSVSFEIVEGFSAISADIKVEIVTGFSAISSDRKICISNSSDLDANAIQKLKLD